ncbi:hypothetical protein ACFQ1Q_03835 [Winogradskyella litorisediminis]|uniref:Uncharacterized protein n=1 Tax=Winogradskyella litorisediminis TaxID=1156618 RepID=A0ABW3N3Y3_9FLAO
MRNLRLIPFLILFNFCASQNAKNYDIYLVFNSNKKEVYISERKINDGSQKFFHFGRKNEEEYTMFINDTGKLEKKHRAKYGLGCCKITAMHDSKENEVKTLRVIDMKNIITYDDFMSVDFNLFYKIIKRAKNVYFVDEGSETDNSIRLKAYEVKF